MRRNFHSLVAERNRFLKVETSKRYHAKFSNRSQKQGESVEEFAAELNYMTEFMLTETQKLEKRIYYLDFLMAC